jgi:hypothetical protein
MIHRLRLSLAGMLLVLPTGCSMLVSASSGSPADHHHQSTESVKVVHRIDPVDASERNQPLDMNELKRIETRLIRLPAIQRNLPLEMNELKPGQHVQLVTTISGDQRPFSQFVNEPGQPCMEVQRITLIAGTIRSADQQELVLSDVVTLSNRNVATPKFTSKLPYLGRLYKNSNSGALSTTAVPGEVRLNRASILDAAEISDSDWGMYQQGSVTERIGVDFDFNIAAD